MDGEWGWVPPTTSGVGARAEPVPAVCRGAAAPVRHDVFAGSWIDPYSGVRVTLSDVHDQRQAEQLPVDDV